MIGYSVKNAILSIKETLYTNFLAKAVGSLALSGLLFDPLKLGIVKAILILSVFDVILGTVLAYKGSVLTVSQAIKGSALKLTTYIIIISTSYIASTHIPNFTMFDDIVIYYILVSEVISIFESANSLGIKVPFIKELKNLRKKYSQFSTKNDA